jgi:hypothetical protein
MIALRELLDRDRVVLTTGANASSGRLPERGGIRRNRSP